MTTLPASPPVLLIFFNRLDCVTRVLDAIRTGRPGQLYLAADGPRAAMPGEADRCTAVREAVERQIDWPCTVVRNYAPVNLGVNSRMVSALSWFFHHEERGIILEDDCLPDPTFFPFCAELLARYAADERVAMISGNQFMPGGGGPGDPSYSFARLTQIWGWATWRRAWRLYGQHLIATWPAARETGLLEKIFIRPRDRRYWRDRFDDCVSGRFPVWDYQWAYARWREGQLGIVPARNLCSNLGFQADGTHTTDSRHPAAAVPLAPIDFPLRHPLQIVPDDRLDRATARLLFSTGSLRARATFRLGQLGRALVRPFQR